MTARIPLYYFLALSAIHLTLIQLNPSLTIFTKPLLIPALLWYYIKSEKDPKRLLVLALIACWAGDCLLMFTERNANFFLTGLGAFLLGHVLYIFSFRSLSLPRKKPMSNLVYSLCIIPVLFAGWLVSSLWDGLGDFRIPVLCYAAVIVTMFTNAVFRIHRTAEKSFMIVTAGALLFMVSDSILAYNMFGSPVPFSGLFIMSTYLSAQLLIVKGLLEHKTSL